MKAKSNRDDKPAVTLGRNVNSGKLCAVKAACTVWRGESGDGPSGTAPGSYPTKE